MGVVGAATKLTANEAETALEDALRVELQTTVQTVARLVQPEEASLSAPADSPGMTALRRYAQGNRYATRVFLFQPDASGKLKIVFDLNRSAMSLKPGTLVRPTEEMQKAIESKVAISDYQGQRNAKVFQAFAPVLGKSTEKPALAGIELPSRKFETRVDEIKQTVTAGWLMGVLLGLVVGMAVFAIRTRQLSEEKALEEAKQALEEVNESLEERVNQRTDQLRQAMEAKSVFLTTAGHELRTPLNGLIGMTTLVLDSDISDESRQYLTMAKDSAVQLTTKVNQLLDLASLETGQLKLEFESTNVAEEVQRLADLFEERAGKEGLRFVNWIDSDLNKKFFVPRRRVLEVVSNLLDNAMKFTETGTVYFTAGVLQRRDGSPWLDLCVQDTGVGIDPNLKEQIFEHRDSFVSLPSHKSGLGIGLAISRRICHLMGGVIEVCDNEGGARFRVLLPLPPVEAGMAA